MNTLGGVFEQSTDAVFGIDTAGVIQFANHTFERLMGYSQKQLCGIQCAEILCGTNLHGQAFCGPDCPIPKTMKGQPTISDFDLVVRRADGDSVLVNIGTGYIAPQLQQRNGQVDVIFSIRPVNPRHLLQRMAMAPAEPPVRHGFNGNGALTTREKEVLSLAARGMTTSQIASQLFLSTLTVRSHFKNIYPKLGVNSRTEAVIYAMKNGLH